MTGQVRLKHLYKIYKIARANKQLLHTLNITRLKLLQSVTVKSDEKLLKVKSYKKCKILLLHLQYNIMIISHTTECSSAQTQCEHSRYQW